MWNYLLKRVLKGLLTIFISVTITFFILRLMPSDPVTIMVDPRMSPETAEQIIAQFGLDQPRSVQYVRYLQQLAQGNLGTSFRTRQPVIDMIMQKLPWTLLLMALVTTTSLLLGIPVGIAAARKPNKRLDRTVNLLIMVGVSVFIPFMSIALLYIFSYKLGWLPTGGAYTPPPGQGLAYVVDVLKHAVLPTFTLFVANVGTIILYSRNSMIDVLGEDYIRTARSKGWREGYILRVHALKNAMIPTITIVGIMIGNLVGGAIMTETIYSWPGIGRMIYESVQSLDFPVLQGAFLMLAVVVVVMSILTDLVISLLDPRIKLGGSNA